MKINNDAKNIELHSENESNEKDSQQVGLV